MAISFLNTGTFPDDAKLGFGDSADLKIWHDSGTGTSYISDQGTGNLHIQADSKIRLESYAATEKFAIFELNGAADIYYDNNLKLSTTNTGIDITGGFVTSSSSDCAGLNMTADIAMGSNDITDSNSSAGTAGQVLSSLGAGNGTDWIDAATGTVTGTGVSGRVAYWNGTSSLTSDADLTFDGTDLTLGSGKINMPNNKAVSWANSSVRGEGNILKLTATTTIQNQQNTQIYFDGGDAPVSLDIHNAGTATGDDAKITFETQAAMDYAIGIDKSDSNKFKISRSEDFGTNDVFSLSSGSAVIADALTLSTIDAIGSDTDKFLMSDSGVIKYVTGANLRSYIGAGTGSGTVTSIATSSPITGGTITGSGTIGIDDATGTTPGAAALDAGTGISLSDSSGVYTVTNSGVTSIVAGTNVTISGATGAVTVNSSDQYSGTVTSVAVTVGTGLDVSGSPITSSGTIDIDLDLSEFTDMTSAMTGTDEFIVLDSSAERRKAANEIGLSIFDNDSGFVTSSGVTSVSATAPITSTGGTTPTIACTTASVTNGSTSLVTGNDVYDFVNGSYLPLDGSSAMEGDLDMDGYDIDNVVNLELNGSAAGAIVLDTALSATSVKGCGTIINFGSTSVTQGSYYYWKSSSAWELTDADTEAKTNGLIAYARFTGTASTGGMLLNGIIHDASHGFTIGSPLYISTSAGTISNTAPSGSGDSVRVVGYAIDSNHIYFCPDNTWVKVS